MIKHFSLIRRNAGQSVEEFRAYWKEVHSQLCKDALPGLRKYVGNFPAAWDETNTFVGTRPVTCDAIIELHFDSVEDMKAAFNSASWQSERRKASSARDHDRSNIEYMVSEEIVVPLASKS